MIDITERKKADEKMVALSRFPEENPLPVLRIAKDGTVLYSNEAGQSMLKHFRSEVGGPIKGELKNSVVSAYKSGKNGEIEVKYDNKVLLVDIVIGADVDYVNLYGSDITENKKAEEEVKSTHKRLLSILDGINALIYVTDMQTYELLFVNKYGRDVWGDVAGKICWETLQEGQSGPCNFCTNKYLVDKEGNPKGPYEWEFKNTVNNRVYFIIDRAIEWYDGRIVRLEIATDITERKKAEEELRESEEKYRVMAHNIPGMVYRGFPDWSVEIISGSKEICGYTTEEINSKEEGWLSIVHPDDKEKIFQEGSELSKAKKDLIQYYRIIDKKGNIRWIEDRKTSLFTKRGEFRGIDGIVVDITERKNADEELRESEERFRKIFDEGPLGMMLTGLDLRFLKVNSTLSRMLGYSEEELLNLSFPDITHPDDVTKDIENAKKLRNGEIAFYNTDKRYIRKDKDVLWIYLTATLIRDEDEKPLYFLTMVEDITERKMAEKSLHESEEKFRTLAEKSPNMIFINNQGKVVFANEKCEELMGYSKEEFYSPEFDFISLIAPEDKELIMDSFKRHMKGEEVEPYEYSLIARNGKRIDALQTSKLIEYGAGTALLGIITDISERKKSEKKLEEKVDELEKWQKLTVGRELRMTNLKEEIEELKKRLKKYEYS
jgi:PAS domain S-box-containing protein